MPFVGGPPERPLDKEARRREGQSVHGPKLEVAARVLYHQVRPLKLATDISTAVASLVLLAEHHLGSALAVMFVPSIIASAMLVQFADFSTTHESRVGAYLRRYMTTTMQGVRFLGMGTAAIGAWLGVWWLLPVGAAVILWGWFGGWVVDPKRPR
jgi:hypothetical protein